MITTTGRFLSSPALSGAQRTIANQVHSAAVSTVSARVLSARFMWFRGAALAPIVLCLVALTGCQFARWDSDEARLAADAGDTQQAPASGAAEVDDDVQSSVATFDPDEGASDPLTSPASAAPSDAVPTVESGTRSALANPNWIRRVRQSGSRTPRAGSRRNGPAGAESMASPKAPADPDDTQWRHGPLEEILSQPPSEQPKLAGWLDDANPVVAGNAAIALARGELDRALASRVAARLTATVRNSRIKLPMRQAAAESFQFLPSESAVKPLCQLAEQYGCGGAKPLPELETPLVVGLLRHGVDPTDSVVCSALSSPSDEVRLAVVRAWPRQGNQPAPPELLALRHDQDPRIRAATIELIAARRPPEAIRLLSDALRDQQIDVRTAAIRGLGRLGGDRAQRTLENLANSKNDAERAAAAFALGHLGSAKQVLQASRDSAWQVRLAAAQALGHLNPAVGDSAVERLAADRNAEVALAVVDAVSSWPLLKAAPVLLSGMESGSFQVRQAAADALASRWPPARGFAAPDPPARRRETMERIRAEWSRDVARLHRRQVDENLADAGTQTRATPYDAQAAVSAASHQSLTTAAIGEGAMRQVEQLVDQLAERSRAPATTQQAEDRLIALGPELVLAIEQIERRSNHSLPDRLFQSVLPQIDELYAAAVQLDSTDLTTRRRAARRLALGAERAPWTDTLLNQIATRALDEPDPLVWQAIQEQLVGDGREPAIRLSYAGLSHPQSVVRSAACRLLAKVGDPAHQKALSAALEDKNSEVAQSAAEALAFCGPPENSLPLLRLLASRDANTRVVAARTLAIFDYTEGRDALVRLAHHRETQIREQAATAMGAVGRIDAASNLISLLDDHPAVRKAAIASLEAITKQSFATDEDGNSVDMDAQAERWRKWYARRNVQAAP